MKQESFWDRVKLQLAAHRYTQTKLAEYIDIPVRTIWSWIHYDRMPDAMSACCIAEALGVTVEYLVRGNDEINTDDKIQRTRERKIAAEKIQKLALQINDVSSRLGL